MKLDMHSPTKDLLFHPFVLHALLSYAYEPRLHRKFLHKTFCLYSYVQNKYLNLSADLFHKPSKHESA